MRDRAERIRSSTSDDSVRLYGTRPDGRKPRREEGRRNDWRQGRCVRGAESHVGSAEAPHVWLAAAGSEQVLHAELTLRAGLPEVRLAVAGIEGVGAATATPGSGRCSRSPATGRRADRSMAESARARPAPLLSELKMCVAVFWLKRLITFSSKRTRCPRDHVRSRARRAGRCGSATGVRPMSPRPFTSTGIVLVVLTIVLIGVPLPA